MISAYRAILAKPGVAAFTVAGLATRLPMAMITLASLLLVQGHTGSYLVAALVLGVSGIANTVAAPLLARRIDRVGQAAVLRSTLGGHVVGVLALVLFCTFGSPVWALFGAAALSGACAPAGGTLIRTRWAHLLGGSRSLQTAYAWESTVDEVLFLAGPAVVTLIATLFSPAAALLVGLAATIFGVVSLSRQTATAPAAQPVRAEGSLSRGVIVVTVVLAAVGGLCGGMSVLVAADLRAFGVAAATGPLLGLWILGSLVSGLAYGAISWRAPLRRRFLLAVALFAIGTLPVAFAPNVIVLAAAMLLAGATLPPIFITAFALVERLVPASCRTQGLTWAGTGMSVSGAAAGAAAGVLLDAFGVRIALTIAVAAGPLALCVALAGYRCLSGLAEHTVPHLPTQTARAGLRSPAPSTRNA